MKFPPIYFTPGEFQPLNGQLPDAIHAGELDAFACWLATRRLPIPPSIGAVMNDGTYTELIQPLQYVEHVGFLLLAAGIGNVVITCSDDSKNAQVVIGGGGTTREDAAYYQVNTPMSSPGGHTFNRAVDIADRSSPHVVTLTFEVPATVYVFEVIPFALPRLFDSELPA